MVAKGFKNIIFDLGGVIINLDESKTVAQFAQISQHPASSIEHHILHFESYKQFEKGLISSEAFREALRNNFGINATDDEIDGCMNAMLLDIPLERIQLLESLRKSSRLFLLSNTNQIHYTCFNKILKETTGDDKLDVYFEKAYYSHQVHMRKPDLEIFERVLSENNLNATETLFLDDNLSNLEGAQQLRINTFEVKNPNQLFELFV
ncbi:MAG: HAD family phosphatase [Cyclobacteriaceae bacterium]|nr:HAD family phosphatase [Cyclobacteriaceae bacterium]